MMNSSELNVVNVTNPVNAATGWKGTAVLLIGFGGPESLAEVEPFLRSVLAGRSIPESRLAMIAERYRSVGGISPFCGEARRFAERLATLLGDCGVPIPVFTSFLHASPKPAELARQLHHTGYRRVFVQILTPTDGYESRDRYVKSLGVVMNGSPLCTEGHPIDIGDAINWQLLPTLCENRGFVETASRQIINRLTELSPGSLAGEWKILFTAHSVPLSMPGIERYQDQVNETARRIVGQLPWKNEYHVAWQSRSGRSTEPWLTPTPVDMVLQHTSEHASTAKWLVVPIGFLLENLELTFDLDRELAATVTTAPNGVYKRLPAIGGEPGLVRLIARSVLKELTPVNENYADTFAS